MDIDIEETGGVKQTLAVNEKKDGSIEIINHLTQSQAPVISEIEFHRIMGKGYSKSREVRLLAITPFVDYHKAIRSGLPIGKDDDAMRAYLKANPGQCIAPDTGNPNSGKIIIK